MELATVFPCAARSLEYRGELWSKFLYLADKVERQLTQIEIKVNTTFT